MQVREICLIHHSGLTIQARLIPVFPGWRTTLLQKFFWRTFYHLQSRRRTRLVPGDRHSHLKNLNGLFGNLINNIILEIGFTESWTSYNCPAITLQRTYWWNMIFYLQIVHGRFWSVVVFRAHALYVILLICMKAMDWQNHNHSVLSCNQLIR